MRRLALLGTCARADDVQAVCDCEPWATVTCTNHRCGFDVGSYCLGGGADAGP